MEQHYQMDQKVDQVRYLIAENIERYRTIMKVFYEKYKKMKNSHHTEDIYREVIKNPYIQEYTLTMCQDDLDKLVEWGNLIATQELKNIKSIEDLQKKKFRYMISDMGISIEYMLEQSNDERLDTNYIEPLLLEHIYKNIHLLPKEVDSKNIYFIWDSLITDFSKLNKNYRKYLHTLSSVCIEDMLNQEQFIDFKNKIVDYLRTFIKELQKYGRKTEAELKSIDKDAVKKVIEIISKKEYDIQPFVDAGGTLEQIKGKNIEKFQSIYAWFVTQNGEESECIRLLNETNGIIQKLTKYAQQLSERNSTSANKKNEYAKYIELFENCADISEAHKLSAMIFGVDNVQHLYGNSLVFADTNNSVYDIEPEKISLTPKIRTFSKKVERTGYTVDRNKNEELRKQILKNIQVSNEKFNRVIKDGVIDFAKLGLVDKDIRRRLLEWVVMSYADVYTNMSGNLEDAVSYSTKDGRMFKVLYPKNNETCVLKSEDGDFILPAYKIYVYDK